MSPLRVEPATADHLRALIAGPDEFQRRFGLTVIEGYLESEFDAVLHRSLDHLTGSPATPEWSTQLFVHDGHHALIGLGGFKGPPTAGAVEIGYGIAPGYRGRGYAIAAAEEMVHRAKLAGITTVLAHTLPEENASTRVLERLGFEQTAVIEAPEDATTWRWELRIEH